ncbi:folylpolyglutamate synthase/dihydrofolate synthase family protein [Pelagibius sp.]|uniref:bifunctional folylpolyglutamate synthase/dihydrofolate synthase n=1 Tax=Pelagibius sp. TaxID=1931238 RepID=UPI002639F600|nr:folylpolyglutamate synthase/dihydrofolate synthase family protein [Pelagibius sp.]
MTPAADADAGITARPGKTSDVVLERLTRLHPKIIDLSLGRVERLLARLGHPEERLAPVVHVAGTNGKGSLLAFLRAMLQAAGQRVQVYSSPHLVRFHERIRLTGGLIGEDALIELLERCETANGPEPITYFEITTAAAFLAFAGDPADVLLLETGLGGRLDATNVVARPRLTAITPIAMDHQQFLGDTLAAIAGEKAGILKAGVPCVVGPQEPAALAVLEARAGDLGVPLFCHGRDWTFEATASGFRYADAKGVRDLPVPALAGHHQVANAALAVACARRLDGFGLDDRAIDRGVAGAEWRGRLHPLTRGPLATSLPEDWELWLDGGHNPAAGQALAETLQGWRDRPLHLVYGMLDTKAAAGFLAPLAPLARDLKAVAIPGEAASLSAEAAAGHAREAGHDAAAAASVADALQSIVESSAPPGRILICGSLYLAGQVLAENG